VGDQCQPRHTVCTDIRCPLGSLVCRMPAFPDAQSRHASTSRRCVLRSSQSGTCTAPGAISVRVRGTSTYP